MNARFWTWVNCGWVKLTIAPGGTLCHIKGGPTEEGYSWERTEWSFDGSDVWRETETEARDCDGRFDSSCVCSCPALELAAIETDDGTLRPDWRRRSASQRDHAAEAMGY